MHLLLPTVKERKSERRLGPGRTLLIFTKVRYSHWPCNLINTLVSVLKQVHPDTGISNNLQAHGHPQQFCQRYFRPPSTCFTPPLSTSVSCTVHFSAPYSVYNIDTPQWAAFLFESQAHKVFSFQDALGLQWSLSSLMEEIVPSIFLVLKYKLM